MDRRAGGDMTKHATTAKRIAPGAYDALVDALALVFWNKPPFERFVRLSLRDHPELLAGVDFQGPKRQAASDVVMRMAAEESKYQSSVLDLMMSVAAMSDFPNLRTQADGAALLVSAQEAARRAGEGGTRTQRRAALAQCGPGRTQG
jgi:hypothetical protein